MRVTLDHHIFRFWILKEDRFVTERRRKKMQLQAGLLMVPSVLQSDVALISFRMNAVRLGCRPHASRSVACRSTEEGSVKWNDAKGERGEGGIKHASAWKRVGEPVMTMKMARKKKRKGERLQGSVLLLCQAVERHISSDLSGLGGCELT